MMLLKTTTFIAILLFISIGLNTAIPTEKDRFLNELDLIDDDGSMDTALINYLFTKQMVKRLRNQMDIGDLQRKRTYWKQCAFNAVSCFGK